MKTYRVEATCRDRKTNALVHSFNFSETVKVTTNTDIYTRIAYFLNSLSTNCNNYNLGWLGVFPGLIVDGRPLRNKVVNWDSQKYLFYCKIEIIG